MRMPKQKAHNKNNQQKSHFGSHFNVKQKNGRKKCFFFSNEKRWIEKVVLLKFGEKCEFKICFGIQIDFRRAHAINVPSTFKN